MPDQPNRTDLNEELRAEIRRLQKPGIWDYGLAVAVGVSLLAMMGAVLVDRSRTVSLDLEVSAPVFFAFLLLLLLLAWLARDRARGASVAQFRSLTEIVHRCVSSEQAIRDTLTGTYNRVALEEMAPHLLSRAERFGSPTSLVVLDLDDFHQLNNSFGHAAGDLALVQFATMLHRSTRGSDLVVRYGGDEFVLLLNETPRSGAEVVIDRIVGQVDARNRRLAAGEIPLGFTAGAAEFRKGSDLKKVFEEADFDLLERKRARKGTRVSRT